MPKVKLAAGKKRYSVTLCEARVLRFKALCNHFHLPATTLSSLCDDCIEGMNDILQTGKENGSLGVNDIFRLMGKQVELLVEEERREMRDTEQKRNTNSNGKRSAGTTTAP
jgi:hypothetical protein